MKKLKDCEPGTGIVCSNKEEWGAIIDLITKERGRCNAKKEYWDINPVKGADTIATDGGGWHSHAHWGIRPTYAASDFLIQEPYPIF